MSEDPEALGNIIKGIKKKYDKDKENWRVMGGVDKVGNTDLIISQNPNLWWIKSKAIDQNPMNQRAISYGKELRNIDDDINKEFNRKKIDSKDVFHSLFGMSVPVSQKDIITAAGIQRIAPREMNVLKKRIDNIHPDTELHLRKKINKSWKKNFPIRDNIYL